MADMKWYVVPRLFGLREEDLAAAARTGGQKGLADKFEEILVPAEEVVEVRRGQKTNQERKFFPATCW
jgi:transcriptional antiterminator NusG